MYGTRVPVKARREHWYLLEPELQIVVSWELNSGPLGEPYVCALNP